MARKEPGRDMKAVTSQRSPKTETAKRESAAPQLNTSAIVQETLSGSGTLDADKVLHLQRTIGNRAVGQLISKRQAVIQAKLTVGAADDPYEREADLVASQVMRMNAAGSPADVSPQEDDTAQRKAALPPITPLVQRAGRTDLSGSFEAGQDVERQLQAGSSGGNPLPARLRSELEPKFGADFSNVRVHTGSQSDSLNRSLGAQAFTHGSHIYVAGGKYNPGTGAGKHLLAHELTHVVQQSGAVNRRVQRYPATSLQSPVGLDWPGDTKKVIRPSEGISGGVFIFESESEPIKHLVVKPEYAEGQKRILNTKSSGEFSGKFLNLGGIPTPDQRLVHLESDEANAIMDTAAQKGKPIPNELVDPNAFMADEGVPIAFLTVMGKAKGGSLSGALKDAKNITGSFELIDRLNNQALMNRVGQMIAFDGFLNNSDRISLGKVNLGNIMFAGDITTAIDNFTMMEAPTGPLVTGDFKTIEELFNKRQEIINVFFTEVEAGITDEVARAMFHNYLTAPYLQMENQQWRGYLSAGIDQGVTMLRTMLKNKKVKKTLKTEAKSWKEQGATNVSWETIREREQYLELMASGVPIDQAKAQLKQYRAYRKRRRERVKGFKWTAKFYKGKKLDKKKPQPKNK